MHRKVESTCGVVAESIHGGGVDFRPTQFGGVDFYPEANIYYYKAAAAAVSRYDGAILGTSHARILGGEGGIIHDI